MMKKKVLSICLCLILSVFIVVPAFAVETNDWWNSIRPSNGQQVALMMASHDQFYYSEYGDSGIQFYNPDISNITGISLNFGNTGGDWKIYMLDKYDYYVSVTVFGWGRDTSKFTFFPTSFTHQGYDHNAWIHHQFSDVQYFHYDGSYSLGFTAVGKFDPTIPYTLPIVSFDFSGQGSVPANLQSLIYIYQVPKASTGASVDAAAIISAINAQTQQLASLIQGNGGDPDAGSVNSELNSAISDIDDVEKDIHDQAEEAFKASDSLINQFDPSQFSSAGNLYKELSESAFGALGSVAVFIFIPLILFCTGAFIGKLK